MYSDNKTHQATSLATHFIESRGTLTHSLVIILFTVIMLFMAVTPKAAYASGYDIWLYPINFDTNNQQWSLGEGHAITDRDGYDNQAAFTQDSQAILFTSDRNGPHNDIYRYSLQDGKTNQLTHTPNESEFSPQDTSLGLMYVVEQGVPHQSVWLQQGNEPRKRAINSMIPSGYYAHIPQVGTFIWARYAYSLYFEPQGETADEGHFVVANAGRSIHAIPNQAAFSFTHKREDGERLLSRFSPDNHAITPLISLGNGSEDYAWSGKNLSAAWIFNIAEDTLRVWPYPSDATQHALWQAQDWIKVAQLKPPSEKHMQANRIAVSPDNQYMTIVWSR